MLNGLGVHLGVEVRMKRSSQISFFRFSPFFCPNDQHHFHKKSPFVDKTRNFVDILWLFGLIYRSSVVL